MTKKVASWTMFKWLIILNWGHPINRRCQNLRCNETTSICAAVVVEPFPTFLKSWARRRKHHIKSRTIEGTFIVLNKSIKQKLFRFAIFVLNIIRSSWYEFMLMSMIWYEINAFIGWWIRLISYWVLESIIRIPFDHHWS